MKKVLFSAFVAMLLFAISATTPVLAGPPEGDGALAEDDVVVAGPPEGDGLIAFGPPEGDG